MANFGIGIGSFLDGFVKGANVRNDWDRQAKSDAREDRRLDMAETRMAQDKEASDRGYQLDVERFGYAQKSGDRAYQLQADQFQHTKSIGDRRMVLDEQTQHWAAEDRAAEAPVKAAERQQRLQGYQDAQSLRDSAPMRMPSARQRPRFRRRLRPRVGPSSPSTGRPSRRGRRPRPRPKAPCLMPCISTPSMASLRSRTPI